MDNKTTDLKGDEEQNPASPSAESRATGALSAALDRLMAVFNEASDERYENLKEWENLGRRWQSEGDGYGYNFHQGMAAGANWCDIYYRRVGREIEAIRKEFTQATASPASGAPLSREGGQGQYCEHHTYRSLCPACSGLS